MEELTSKNQIFELLKKERKDCIFHKVYVAWKNEFGFYCIHVNYEIVPSPLIYNGSRDRTSNATFPYPVAEYKKLNDIERLRYDDVSKSDLERFKILLERSFKLKKIRKNIKNNEHLDNQKY